MCECVSAHMHVYVCAHVVFLLFVGWEEGVGGRTYMHIYIYISLWGCSKMHPSAMCIEAP